MLAQLGKTAAVVALIAAPAAASAGDHGYNRYGGGYQASAYAAQSYSASTRIEEKSRGVTGLIGDDGRAHLTGYYEGGYADGGLYGEHHDVSGFDPSYSQAHMPPAGHGAPCPQVGGERVLRCVYVPRVQEIHLSDSFFAGGGGVGPDYVSGGRGGGGFVMVGGMASAGARAGAYASASASASARVSISGRIRGGGKGGRKGGKGCCH